MQRSEYRFVDAFWVFMVGVFLNAITPGWLGEMGQGLYLKQDGDLPLSEGLAMASDLDIGLPYLAVCLLIAGVRTLLPISFAGLGTRDAS